MPHNITIDNELHGHMPKLKKSQGNGEFFPWGIVINHIGYLGGGGQGVCRLACMEFFLLRG